MDTLDLSLLPEDPRSSSPDSIKGQETETGPPIYETVATVPLKRDLATQSQFETMATLPLNHAWMHNGRSDKLSQPTQLIDRSSPDLPTSPSEPIVQVAASSPMAAPQRKPSGILASAMAPAGTAFRRPYAPPAPKRDFITINSDDEGPTYQGGSSESDRENFRKNDIKTSTFFRRNQDKSAENIPESPQPKKVSKTFQEITANSFYKPSAGKTFVADPRIRNPSASSLRSISSSGGVKRLSDGMADAYGNASKKPRQMFPSRAQPVVIDDEPEMSLDDITDYNSRQKTKRMTSMLTSETVTSCYKALTLKKGSYDDAVEYLMTMREKTANAKSDRVDLTGSEDELLMTPAQGGTLKPVPKAVVNESRQQAKKPAKTIQEKWGSTQVTKKPVPKLDVFDEPTKKARTLVRGRKNASSPVVESPKALQKVTTIGDSEESDEADTGTRSNSGDRSFTSRLLSFFNKCSANDLADTATITADLASHFVSKRPFRSLNAIASIESPNAKPGKGKRKAAPIGEKILDKCEEMLKSYEAVDYLVKKCEAIAKPLAMEMKSWGVDIYGSKQGELDMVSLKDSQKSTHDSGIGTPVSDADEERMDTIRRSTSAKFIAQPVIMADDIVMKDYQVVGINWLTLLYKKNLSCILADDMGLGKTCQVIGFLAHLLETGEKGPHLVVVPAATLENWLQEFHRFCPALNVEPYYAGTPKERIEISARIDANRDDINVVITTYTVARGKDDFPWLKHFGFCCTVFDEGHVLKNAESQLTSKLIRIQSKFRLLLTGTPLQNNLKELISLLAFMMPALFREKKEELHSIFTHNVKAMDDNHEALLSAQRIARARSMLAPFILRRKKYQVLKDLPKKERRVEYCDMTPQQADVYSEYLESARDIRARRAAGENVVAESTNILMRLRQASIHPLLFRRNYKDKQLPIIAKTCLQDPLWTESIPSLIVQELTAYSDMEIHRLCDDHPVLQQFTLNKNEWLSSGKVQKMLQLLRQFTSEGHRTLIFSQFVMVLDILELVFDREAIAYFRLDGSTKVSERQDLIDEFCSPENDTPVFMLSTKAGGAGINLAKANKVIVFDSGFNPQDDIQAENRAHRIGQEKEVEVIRLVSRGTVEEQIYAMGLTKLRLDEQVAGDEKEREKEMQRMEEEGRKAVEELFFKKLEAKEDVRAPKPKEETDSEPEIILNDTIHPEEEDDSNGDAESELSSSEDLEDEEQQVRMSALRQSAYLPSRTKTTAGTGRKVYRGKAKVEDD